MSNESIKRLKNDKDLLMKAIKIMEKYDITRIDKSDNILNSMICEDRKCLEEICEKFRIANKAEAEDMLANKAYKLNDNKAVLLKKLGSFIGFLIAIGTFILSISPYIMGPIDEYKIKKLIGNFHVNYIQAVNEGNSDMINDYVIKDSDAYREYRKYIPEFYEKQIALEDKGQTINYINKEENKRYRVTTIDKFSIKHKDGSIKYQEEKRDYIVARDLHTKKLLIYKIEDWNIVG